MCGDQIGPVLSPVFFFYEWKGTDRDILKNKKGENRKGLLNGSVDNSGITQMV